MLVGWFGLVFEIQIVYIRRRKLGVAKCCAGGGRASQRIRFLYVPVFSCLGVVDISRSGLSKTILKMVLILFVFKLLFLV